MSYSEFLARKAVRAQQCGIDPAPMPAHLFDFQAACTAFCLRAGRAALFLDTGLGKTVCQIEWCRQAAATTGRPALILTPLAVARQIEAEGKRFGYEIRVIREESEVGPGINVCNYDRLDKLDPAAFGAVSLDESSILKNFTGAVSRALRDAFSGTPFRLCATATPAPNDHMELGQHADFLGIMPSNEMLARWFITDQTQMGRYRLKRHGETDFWDWVASWARCAQTPDDLGFDGSQFVLPPLHVHRHAVVGDTRAPAGELFAADVSATTMHAVKRETAEARADAAFGLIDHSDDVPWVFWVDTDYEADSVMAVLPAGRAREVRGSHPIARKEKTIAAFLSGEFPFLVTKPEICGFGLNLQMVADTAFVGRSFSYERYYQAVRRFWRFGQSRPVNVHLIVAEGEDQIGRVIERKATEHSRMREAMAAAMRRALRGSETVKTEYNPMHISEVPEWLLSAA